MVKGINYWAFPPNCEGKLLSAIETLDKAKELGYDAVEFTVDPAGAITPQTTQKEAEAIKAEADKRGIKLITLASGLAWGASPTSADPKVRSEAQANAKTQIR
jgi:L-ribulose-5-phosphate 3-epimerase